MMNDSTVVNKVKKRIDELEQAIQQLDFVKRHLNQNSSVIKSQIHTSISRHLESLRNREVWLLGQVDTVLVDKEEVLQQQQARLNKALGILHSSLTHVTDSEDDSAARHLVQALEELNSMELKAEETPYIAFRADQLALRESILSYGRVDPNGMPLMSAFADDDKPSASLPRHIEEYEDTEHHLFYKALQDGKGNSSSIRVTLPKLSSRVEDWLQRPVLQLSTSASEARTPTSDTVSTPVSQTTCAIQNWLSEIKHNPDGEEDDDFEIVDHSGSSQRAESPAEEDMKPMQPPEQVGFVDMFRHVPMDVQKWLLNGGSAKSGTATAEELRAFFKHIPRDTSLWLATARHQLDSLDKLKQGGWFHHVPTEPSTWLRRAHDKRTQATQAAVPDMFTHITQDRNAWLREETCAADETESQDDMNKLNAGTEDQGSFLSKASNPASVSPITNPMKGYLASSSTAMECWLLRQGEGAAASSSSPLPGLPGIQRYLTCKPSSRAWLAEAAEVEMESQPAASSKKFFSHVSSTLSDWLLVDKTKGDNCNPPPTTGGRKITSDDQWLHPGSAASTGRSATFPSSPMDSLLQSYRHMTTSDWLVVGQQGQGIEGAPSEASWKVLSESPQTSSSFGGSSFGSGIQIPSLDLATWIYQKHL